LHGARLGWYVIEQWESEEASADSGWTSCSCKVVASGRVFCVHIPECCFDALELLSLNLSCPSPVSESLYLSNKSDITHLFENSVNHSSGFVGWLEDLEVVVAKHTAVVETWVWFWFGMQVAVIDWFVVAHSSFDIWVLSDEVIVMLRWALWLDLSSS
jgi:hypothetical protein